MADTHVNRLRCTVSAVASAGLGAFTVSAASSGYRTFGASNDGQTFTVLVTEGTAWEVNTGCTYTHSGTILARGTLADSSTGSAITFTAAAIITEVASADHGRRWDAAALAHAVGPDANTTMAVNTLYVVDMSAWATADRTYTLPAVAAVGDRIGVMVSAGDASHELILAAGSGDTLNAVAGGTEWSRVFITGEVVVMRCVTANAAWIVEYDGRIPCNVTMQAASIQTGIATSTWTTLTKGASGSWSTPVNVGSIADTGNHSFITRRAGNYLCVINANMGSTAASTKVLVGLQKNATGNPARCGRLECVSADTYPQIVGTISMVSAASDSYRAQILHTAGSNKDTDWISGELQTTLSAVEVF